MKRVVIVGMGFGGLHAARALAGTETDVLLIDRQNYHLFQPLLYQVATANLEQENIAYPIRAIIRPWRNVRFLLGNVLGVDLDQHQVHTDGGNFSYDYLILALGSASNFYGLESVERRAFALKHLGDAVVLRNQILTLFERAAREADASERAALLTFVIVGAGPTGVEFSGALAEITRHTLVKDYPELRVENARIVLVEALDKVLPTFSPRLQRYAAQRLHRLGVEILLQKAVTSQEPGRILFKDGSTLHSHTLIWTAGVRAPALVEGLPVPKGPGRRLRVQPDLTLEGHPEVFALGDMIYLEQDGAPLPMVAPVAMQQGKYAAKAILRRERGQPIASFRYRDRGSMAIIGRYAAVASVYGVDLSGLVAWLAWLTLHLFYLIGFRNRLIALLNWIYAYLLQDPKVRLITRASEPPATPMHDREQPT